MPHLICALKGETGSGEHIQQTVADCVKDMQRSVAPVRVQNDK